MQHELLTKMRDGVTAKDVYAAAVDYVKGRKPELEKNFVKNIGFGVSRICPFQPLASYTHLGHSIYLSRWAWSSEIAHGY